MVINNEQLQRIMEEMKKRTDAKENPPFVFENFAFPKQYEFFRSAGKRFRVACCSRRGGKSIGIAGDAVDLAIREANSILLYITLSQSSARKIIWGPLVKLIEEYGIPCDSINHQRLEIHFKNGSKFYVAGAKDTSEIEKFRGWKLRRAYIDECQSFRPYIKELIKDIITPALRDLRGELFLTGTPGPVKAGFFYEACTNGRWQHFHWTAFDNPFMHDPPILDLHETLAEELELSGGDENDPSWRRETYGEWVDDPDSLVFKYDATRNGISTVPNRLTYIIGIDIGYHDADAIAVVGYSDTDDKCYLVEEMVNAKQDITSLMERINDVKDRYNPVKIVMDTGGLGKKIQEELRKRFTLPIESAEKNRKYEFIELLNGDLRKGKFRAYSYSEFAQDCQLVQWDKSNPERLKISDKYHSDITDAVLYAWREANHYLYTPPETKINLEIDDPDEFMRQEEEKEAEFMRKMAEDDDFSEYEQYLDELNDFYEDF